MLRDWVLHLHIKANLYRPVCQSTCTYKRCSLQLCVQSSSHALAPLCFMHMSMSKRLFRVLHVWPTVRR